MSSAPEEMNLSQAPTMRAPHRWPLVNTLDSRDGQFTKDAQIINGYAEKSKVTGLYTVEKRPGFAVTLPICVARRFTSSYVIRLNGPISPGR